ncbi:lipoyl(octanoyl) transferase LipB [Salinicola sp. DM10]|uniref:lipoyl(octanoyl) transferase LipB n=1 Tax=Salinicola sp. DM10 TaxID=2815721 RepID=UPI001A8FA901|nr:lipoyl(octanoyl) transferase LipB [Salinicola sp. DM10]MCE3025424.1 lipoyl(octanoyl) transferase LipB [Salinicola sp. DM10]
MAELELYRLGRAPYRPVWEAMSRFTDTRDGASVDQLWLVQHDPVFTQGRAGKPEHLLLPGDIPVVASDRGGQVTYHGPGQIVLYPLLDVRRLGVGVRELVSLLEQAVIDLLAVHGIDARARADAPGVYVGARKIASLGLRIRRGCSFHGVALNVDMDLAPFSRINPCGYAGLEMTQLRDLGVATPDLDAEATRLAGCFAARLGATLVERTDRPAALTADAMA